MEPQDMNKYIVKMSNKTGRRLTEIQVAECLAISRKTLQRWRRENCGPPFEKFGRSVRYSEQALEVWMSEQAQNTGEKK